MKVLVSGMTGQQAGKIPLTGYMTLASCVVRLMRDLGHEVDFRLISVGEDLSEYDLMILGIMSPFSVAAKNIYTVLSALDRYWSTEQIPVIVLVDDWTGYQIDQNSRSARRLITRLTRESIFDRRPGYQWATSPEGMGAMIRVMEHVTETGWPPAIFPAFAWGDHSVFRSILMAEDYYPLDPTCYTPVYPFETVPPEERKREWVLAAISTSDWTEEFTSTWPLRLIGGGMTKRDASSVMMETEVVQEYARNWGVLSSPYKKLLRSGWWRNRFVYAAMTRAILYCDPEEAPQLGEPYLQSFEGIEKMTTAQLGELAESQATTLRANCWTGEQLHEEARKMIQEVMA